MRCRIIDITANDTDMDKMVAIAKVKVIRSEKGMKENDAIDESQNLPIGNSSKKFCNLCERACHNNQYECVKFKRMYSVTLLSKSDSTARDNIAKSILQVDTHLIYNRNVGDKRIVMKELPKNGSFGSTSEV